MEVNLTSTSDGRLACTFEGPRKRLEYHTVLGLAPDESRMQGLDASPILRSENYNAWNKDGRVADATCWQYGYDNKGHMLSNYLLHKTAYNEQQSGLFEILPFGSTFRKTHGYGGRGELLVETFAIEGGIRLLNKAVYSKVMKLGGPYKFLFEDDHQKYEQSYNRVVKAARKASSYIRSDIDYCFFPPQPSPIKEEDRFFQMHDLIYYNRSEVHDQVMAVYERVSARENL